MATTGTYNFDPKLAELLDEAAERAGMDPVALGAAHIKSAMRSLKFMLNSEWSTIGVRQWMVEQATQSLSEGDKTFTLPAGAIDVLGAVLRRDGKDTEMYPISRQEYLILVDKDSRGRPDRYFVDRQAGAKTVYFWQAAVNSTDVIVYDFLRQIEDVGNMQSTFELPAYAFDAAADGLAMRLAQKFNRERYDELRVSYGGPAYPERLGGRLERLRQEDRERSDIEIRAVYEPRTGRRW